MASKERIQRLKDDTRNNILAAALDIVKEEGWPALSMRKIADRIEYTAPIIYEYFASKEGILQELTKMGYLKLAAQLKAAGDEPGSTASQLEAMWKAYWNFAFAEKELYQVMFGVQTNCSANVESPCAVTMMPATMLWNKIEALVPVNKRTKEYVDRCYYTFWSVVHGLISINLTRQLTSDDINRQVLQDAISGMIQVIET